MRASTLAFCPQVGSDCASLLEKWPAAIFRISASLPPPKSVVFVGCTRGESAQIESDGLLGATHFHLPTIQSRSLHQPPDA